MPWISSDAGTLQTFPQIHPTADSLLLRPVTGLWASLQNPSASALSASLSLPTTAIVEKSDHGDNVDGLFWEVVSWFEDVTCVKGTVFCCKSCFDDTVRSYVETRKIFYTNFIS